MISEIFIVLAAICNAVMDSVEYETVFSKTIFSKKDPKFWLKTVSCDNVKFLKFTKYRPDAWHLSKSTLVVFVIISIVTYSPVISPFLDFFLLGLIWNITFNLFYNKIFRL